MGILLGVVSDSVKN